MTSYNKNYLDTLAKEKGFIRDNHFCVKKNKLLPLYAYF